MMAIDMNAPGVEVKPLREITGESHFNEVFFDGVFVPDTDVVGDVNRGWLVARATLGNERISIGGGSSTTIAFSIDDLVKLLDRSPSATAAAYVRPAGKVIAHFHTLRLLNLRRASRAIAGAEPGPEGNVTKLVLAEQQQRLTELGMELAGTAAVVGQMPRLMRSYMGGRAITIAGGTSEISRNTIAERILGLPRDPLLK
jgi:alkylation response protein AidB-like acyl-CoA dehydrogenase